MSLFRLRIEQILFSLAIFVLIFSNDEKYALLFQVLGVALICAAAAVCLLRGRTRLIAPTIFDALMLLMASMSLLASVISFEQYVAVYTIIFMVTYAAIMVLTRSMNEEEIMACALISIVLTLVIVTTIYLGSLLETLRPGALNRWELRFAPFNMHPNLAGYVYGGFIVIVLFSNTARLGRFAIYLKFALVTLCMIVILAASARGGLLALFATLLIYSARTVIRGGKQTKYVLIVASTAGLMALFYYEKILTYLTEILELELSTRGVDSGGSGRFELWQQGISVITSRTWEIYIGSGLRSASEGILGFHTENSYITICIEFGIAFSLVLLLYLFYLVFRVHKIERFKGREFDRFVFYCALFAMIQSVFNRYLMAIGNPFSLIFLIILSKADICYSLERRCKQLKHFSYQNA